MEWKEWMELVHVFFTSIGSAVVMFLLTKIMGKKSISQLTMFDFVIGITIGSIAAEMATSLETDYLKPLLAMVVYALLSILISYAMTKSIVLRRFLYGKSLILFQDGEINDKNLKKSRLDVSEFLTQCRNSGYFNIGNLQTAILEPNGKISFLPLSTQRPATPKDLKINPQSEKPLVNVVIDGKILQNNLKFTGNDEKWLYRKLKAQGIQDLSEVFLATCDVSNEISVYIKLKKPMTRDIFQ
nr:DUF421 domain-containing protein [Sedimentibacter sp.]